MERNTPTTANQLKIGDRFYKLADKSRKPYEMVESDPKTTQYRTYKLFCIPAAIMDAPLLDDKKKRNQMEALLTGTPVVFLRHVCPQQQEYDRQV